jgi:hypothetical protein
MGYRTPYEGWNGRKPHLGHMRVFGCRGHVKIVGTHLRKLDDRSMPMVYFGIEEGSKAHRMYNPQNKKIIVSRDVVFEESVKWSWDAVNDIDFSENREERDGQFFSGDFSNIDDASGDVQDAQQSQETGGASSSGMQSAVGEEAGAGMNDSQSFIDQNPTTENEPATPQYSPQVLESSHEVMDLDDTIDDDSGPIRFRSFDEVYDDSYEVELMDENVEALLVEVEEPACLEDAVVNQDWVDAMDNEMQSIEKIRLGSWLGYQVERNLLD